jgi:hypothetical protein
VAVVLLAGPVDPPRGVVAAPAAAGIRRPVGPGAAAAPFAAVAEPAAALAGDEAVAEGDDRGRPTAGAGPRLLLPEPPAGSRHQRRARRGDHPPHVSPF